MKFTPITTRKIGAIEVLLFALAFEAIRAQPFGVLVYLAVLVVFFTARAHFDGDFSLSQVFGLFGKKESGS